jgi:hypothetical protein
MSPDGTGQQTSENDATGGRNIRHGDRGPLRTLVTGLRIDGQNAVIPPSRPTVSPQDQPETRSRHQYYGELSSSRPYEIANFGSLMAARAAVDRPEWQTPLSQGEVDRCGSGVIDERGRGSRLLSVASPNTSPDTGQR